MRPAAWICQLKSLVTERGKVHYILSRISSGSTAVSVSTILPLNSKMLDILASSTN
jgi:hypothetical protein